MVKVTENGTLNVYHLPTNHRQVIAQALRIANPDYHKMLRKNPKLKYSPTLKEHYEYAKYNREEDCLILPRGTRDRLRAFGARHGIEFEWSDHRTVASCTFPEGNYILRPYQRGICSRLIEASGGCVHGDCGSGKTLIGLRLAAKLGQKTLIIVPTVDILNQFVDDFKKFYGSEAGVICGKQDTRGLVTVATVQTLIKRPNLGDEWGCVIVDEAHLYASDRRYELLGRITAKYRYGMTGTTDRTDGQWKAVEWLLGPVVARMEIERRQPEVWVAPYKSEDVYDAVEYYELADELAKDHKRNNLIAHIVDDQMKEGRKTLVLTKRVAHYLQIANLVDGPERSVVPISSDMKRTARAEWLKKLRKNPDSYDIILGTYSLLSTGFDVPSLDTLIIAGDLKSSVLTTQSVSRILRLFEGKPKPVIIDLEDMSSGILRNQARERRKVYTRFGWNIRKDMYE